MGAGRFLCVGMPVLLVTAAIVSMLIATLSGVAHNRLYLFSLDTENITVSHASLGNFKDRLGIDLPGDFVEGDGKNVTAKELKLAKSYDVNLFGYCWVEMESGDRHCTDAKFDWASESLNSTYIENLNKGLDLPEEVEGALKAFVKFSKYTQVAAIVALIALGLELVVGVFSNFSRAISCITWLIAGIATTLTGVAATLATVQAAVVIGTVEATAKWYGAKGSINGRYLATVWISFAFALAAGMFWIFTICCCKPDHSSRKSKRGSSSNEKMFGTSAGYAPLGNSHEMQPTAYNSHQQPSAYGAPRYPDASARTDMAYEPYSHRV
jgi:hypothetical protein